MTKLGKALVVFVTVMSLAFLAFIGVTALAGPNWQLKANELEGYAFERTGGENPVWKVTNRVTGADLGSKPTLPAAIRDAQNDLAQRQQEQLATLDQDIAGLQEVLEAEKVALAADEAGIQLRLDELNQALAQLDANIVELTRTGTQEAQKAAALRAEADARRQDVARLQTEIAQVRTDHYQITEQIKQLEQRMIRMGGQIDRAVRRQTQLQDRTSEYDPAASGG